MRELDAVLQAYLERDWAASSDADKDRFEALLDLPDPALYGYLVRGHAPDDSDTARLLARIRRSLDPEA